MISLRPILVVAACAALVACDGAKKDDGKAAAPAAEKHDSAGAPDRAKVVAAYDKGLDFLAGAQKDGVWGEPGKPFTAGFTGLAVTPFLKRPDGVRESDKAMIAKSLAFCASSLGPDGGVKAPESSNYETSVVVMALAASKDAKWKPDIDRAAAYLKKLQYTDPKDPSYGGIGYGDDGPRSDLSNTNYALQALKAAGVPPDDPAYQKALAFLSRCQNRKENETPGEPTQWTDPDTKKKVVRGNDGGAVYFPGNGEHTGFDQAPDGTLVLRSYGSMTYALLHCYHLAGLDKNDGRVKAATDWIGKHWTLESNPGIPAEKGLDGLYYYYAAIGKTLPDVGLDKLDAGGKSIDWRAELSAKLLAEQKPGGMWQNKGPRWMESDPRLATAYALTALAGCVR